VGSGDVDDGGGLDEVVRGLERGVALADDQYALVGELFRVDGHRLVAVGELDARNIGEVRLRRSGGDDQPAGRVAFAVLVGDREPVAGALDPGGAGVVADGQVGGGGIVGEVADHVAGVGEIPRRIGGEERTAVAEQRVPVHAEVELRVGGAGVALVDGDQLTVTGKGAKESAGRRPGL
jgi:hypothetical protein